MRLVEAWKHVVFERYAVFEGRADRAEYWWFFLANFIIFAILGTLAQVSTVFLVIDTAAGLAVFIPSLAVAMRRLHDTGRSGWWLLIGLIPIAGFIIVLVLLALEGDRGPNQYGAPTTIAAA
jgi:uncharacterized membrane protein YhaH (DUF805 family)